MGSVGNISFNQLALSAAVATAVCAAQAIAGAGNATINGTLAAGGVATLLEFQRRVAVVSSGAGDTTQSVTLTGTNGGGQIISETIALNGTTSVSSKLDYKTVTKVFVSAALAGNLSVGTNTVGSMPWIIINTQIMPVQIGFFAHLVSGAANFSVELTMDDPMLITGQGAGFGASIEPDSYSPPIPIADQSTGGGPITAKSADTVAILNFPAFAYRLTINSGTGTVSLQGIQAGIHL